MLSKSSFLPDFNYIGNFNTHFGIFDDCGMSIPFGFQSKKKLVVVKQEAHSLAKKGQSFFCDIENHETLSAQVFKNYEVGFLLKREF